jgi:hypothetical protein
LLERARAELKRVEDELGDSLSDPSGVFGRLRGPRELRPRALGLRAGLSRLAPVEADVGRAFVAANMAEDVLFNVVNELRATSRTQTRAEGGRDG